MRNTWLPQVLEAPFPRLCKESCLPHFSSKTQSSLKLPPKPLLLSQCRSTSLLLGACKVWGTMLLPKSYAGEGRPRPKVGWTAHAQGSRSLPSREAEGSGWVLLASGSGPHSQTCQSPKPANVQGHSHWNALLRCIVPRPIPPGRVRCLEFISEDHLCLSLEPFPWRTALGVYIISRTLFFPQLYWE